MCLPDKSPAEVVSPPAFLGLRAGGVVAVASVVFTWWGLCMWTWMRRAVAPSRSSVVCCLLLCFQSRCGALSCPPVRRPCGFARCEVCVEVEIVARRCCGNAHLS